MTDNLFSISTDNFEPEYFDSDYQLKTIPGSFYRLISPSVYEPPPQFKNAGGEIDIDGILRFLGDFKNQITVENAVDWASIYFPTLGISAENWDDFRQNNPDLSEKVFETALTTTDLLLKGYNQYLDEGRELSALRFLSPILVYKRHGEFFALNASLFRVPGSGWRDYNKTYPRELSGNDFCRRTYNSFMTLLDNKNGNERTLDTYENYRPEATSEVFWRNVPDNVVDILAREPAQLKKLKEEFLNKPEVPNPEAPHPILEHIEIHKEKKPMVYQIAFAIDASGSMDFAAEHLGNEAEAIVDKMLDEVDEGGTVEVALFTYVDSQTDVLMPFFKANESDSLQIEQLKKNLRDSANQAASFIRLHGGNLESFWYSAGDVMTGKSRFLWNDQPDSYKTIIVLADDAYDDPDNAVQVDEQGTKWDEKKVLTVAQDLQIQIDPVIFQSPLQNYSWEYYCPEVSIWLSVFSFLPDLTQEEKIAYLTHLSDTLPAQEIENQIDILNCYFETVSNNAYGDTELEGFVLSYTTLAQRLSQEQLIVQIKEFRSLLIGGGRGLHGNNYKGLLDPCLKIYSGLVQLLPSVNRDAEAAILRGSMRDPVATIRDDNAPRLYSIRAYAFLTPYISEMELQKGLDELEQVLLSDPASSVRIEAMKNYSSLSERLSPGQATKAARSLRRFFSSTTWGNLLYSYDLISDRDEAISAYQQLAGKLSAEEKAMGAQALRQFLIGYNNPALYISWYIDNVYRKALSAYVTLVQELPPDEKAKGLKMLEELIKRPIPTTLREAALEAEIILDCALSTG